MHLTLGSSPAVNRHETEHLALVRQVLEAFQHAGEFRIDITQQITWRANNKVIQVVRVDKDCHNIELKLKPGDNSSCWLAKLWVPNGVSAETVADNIRTLADWNGRTPIGAKQVEQRPLDPLQPINAKLQKLRETAAMHMKTRQRIIELRKAAEDHFQAAEVAESSANELEQQLASDHAGRGAYEALQAVHDLLHVNEVSQ